MRSTIQPAEGKLGVLIVGNGAVATTFMTGVLMARKGYGARSVLYRRAVELGRRDQFRQVLRAFLLRRKRYALERPGRERTN